MEKVFRNVNKLTLKYAKIWLETNDKMDFPIMESSSYQQQIKENQLNNTFSRLTPIIENIPEKQNQRDEWQKNLKVLLKKEAKKNLDIKNADLQNAVVDEFMEVADEFIIRAREFDNQMELEDIMQAIRNVWIMNLIQIISNNDVKLTNSTFAYSMLYPYTDNYIDNKEISDKDKNEFSERLGKRLEAEKMSPMNQHEEKVFELVALIEDQYNRQQYPDVFDSILSIFKAQCKSMHQQKQSQKLNEEDILLISAEKGGTSVLADAYLVCGELKDELSELMFAFGFVLQLIDDLQDVKMDLKNKHMTVFALQAQKGKLDKTTNKLVKFAYNVLNFEKYNSSQNVSDIKDLILENTMLLVFQSICNNKKHFTKEYIKLIQKYSPYSFKYFKRVQRKMNRVINKLVDKF